MSDARRFVHPLISCGVGACFATLAVAVRVGLSPLLGETVPFLTLFPAVIAASLWRGAVAGVACTIACVLGAWLWLLPAEGMGAAALVPSVVPERWTLLFGFVCSSALLVVTGGWARRSRERASRLQVDLVEQTDRLRRSEQLYRTIGESIDYGVWVCNKEGRNTYASPSFLKLLGITQDQCSNLGWIEYLHPEDAADTMAAWEACAVAGTPWDRTHRFLGADGRWHAILARGMPLREPDGTVGGWAGINLDIARLKAAEQRLEESESLLRRVLGGVLAFVAVLAPDGTVVEATGLGHSSGPAVEGAGPPGETLWESLWFSVNVGFRGAVSGAIDRAAGGEAARFDVEARGADGVSRTYDFMVTPLRDGAGAVMHVVVSAIDVTRRVEAQAEVVRTERMLRLINDTIPDLIFRKDREGRLLYANPAVIRLLEMDGVSPIGRNESEYLSDASQARAIREIDQRVMSSGQGLVIEEKVIAGGEERVFQSSKFPEFNEKGEVVGLVGIARDMTEWMKTQRRLEESERRHRAFTESVPALLWATDGRGRATDHNQRWKEYTGFSFTGAGVMNWRRAIHPADFPAVAALWRDAVRKGSSFQTEYRLRRASDGTFRWHSVRAVVSRDECGRIVGWFGACVDIEDKKRAEEVLARDKQTLEQLVADRTQELERTHQLLRMSERMSLMGTLSAGLGHDMGNLLVPIRVKLGLLLRSEIPESVREDAEAIRSSLEYLQKLSNGLRLLAHDPARASPLETTELRRWADEARGLLKNVLPHGVGLVIEVEEDVEIRIARSALTQIAFNLVQNAGDAMRSRGWGQVRVRASRVDEMVRITVSDDGPGMTAETRARCFEPFYSTKARGISTGMGLSLVYSLVRRAGGEITVESEPGAGTCFLMKFAVFVRGGGVKRLARVEIRDPRMRAFVMAELEAAQIEVAGDASHEPAADLWIVESIPGIIPSGSSGFLCAEEAPAGLPPGWMLMGSRPSPHRLRDAIRSVLMVGPRV